MGGSARPEETDFPCMSRSAKEDTGGALSLITIARILEGRGTALVDENAKSYAVEHDLVHPADLNVTERFEPNNVEAMPARATIDKKKNKKKRASTKQLGLEFVPLDSLRSWEWRGKNMHHGVCSCSPACEAWID